MENKNMIYTIGHSTHIYMDFVNLLKPYGVELVVDIRRFPGSRKFPIYNKQNLEINLPKENIQYIHMKELGGRRKVQSNSLNQVWGNKSFQGYADYMLTEEFHQGINLLKREAMKKTTAFMCSEALWWRCHRAMVSDYLKAEDWKVLHIMSTGKIVLHPYTAPATIENNRLIYK
ncbi:DUF488 domain-containing protein [Sphingobacterium paucimobilis]|uniref:Iron-sulfur cluster assembly protein HesB n=1 Tax=Sphingobacterium paucimobilis HER1398 TaxID=1346330 RepID=U2J2X5_9SPHI|nr:DUF488 domain-containing protein [Sphingobacterium paucimobilis]ERJ59319.1 hypothetical protein M472_11090 [Sphingobacterium paucimobilis HER1398]